MVATRTGKRSRRTRLTNRGWVFLVIAALLIVLAYALRRPELLFVGCFVAAVPLLSLFLIGLQRPTLDVRRTFTPLVLVAGRPATVRLQVTNLAPRPFPASSWTDAIGWLPKNSATGMLGPLRSGLFRHREPLSSTRLSYDLTPPRRGQFEIGPFTITMTDPFGLASGTQLANYAQTATVVPEVQALPESGLTIAVAEGSARLVQHRAVGGDHDITTRAYRTGDALRRVHWRASAHHGDLMVRQEEQRSHSEASVLLDTRRSGYRDANSVHPLNTAESDRFEWAVEFTASLVVHLQHSGFIVHMHESAQQQLSSVENTTHFLESLATIGLSPEPLPMDVMLAGGAEAGRTPGSMFAVISDADAELVDTLAARRSNYELAVAFLIMPDDASVSLPLSKAGWTCVIVRPGDSAEDAWLAVVDSDGGRRAS
ncbi:MAG: DUF58 domain-containing protein [Homoserinimonas sp.]